MISKKHYWYHLALRLYKSTFFTDFQRSCLRHRLQHRLQKEVDNVKKTEARLPAPYLFMPYGNDGKAHSTKILSPHSHTQPKLKTAAAFLLLYCLVLFSSSPFAQNNDCSSFSFDKRARVTQVYDGDTVRLENGEKIRLIGINTPEMNYGTGKPEPYAKKAKRFLEKRVLKKRVGIKYGTEKKDRYKRSLGHIFLLDGTNLQYKLLEAGLAFNVTFPPNLWRNNCYKQAAQQAQYNRLKIWKSPYYKPVKATKVNKSKLGFRRITGTVKQILPTKKTVWVTFSDKMALRINKKDLHYFKNLPLKQLVGKQITASGWISFYKHSFSMKIMHPNSLIVH